jgi:hypothetical protein
MLLNSWLYYEPVANVELLEIDGNRLAGVNGGKYFSAVVHAYPYIKRLREDYLDGKNVTDVIFQKAILDAKYWSEINSIREECLQTVFNVFGEFEDLATAIDIMSYCYQNPADCNVQLLSATVQTFHIPVSFSYPNNKDIVTKKDNVFEYMRLYADAAKSKHNFKGYKLNNLASIIISELFEAFIAGRCITRDEEKDNVFFFKRKTNA